MRRILLLGYFGASNLGDDCLLADFLCAHCDFLRAGEFEADVVYNGTPPLAGFIERSQLEPLLGECIDKKELLSRKLDDYAALVLPGGSVLQDSSSLKSLLFYLEVIRRAAGQGVPVCLLHQGIGPLSSWLGRALTPRWLRRSALLSLRDEQSFEWARTTVRQLSNGSSPLLSADPVLLGRLQADPALLPGGLEPGKYLLCAPRPTGDLPHRADPTSEAEALARLLKSASDSSGLPVVLVAFQPSADMAFCQEVARLVGPQGQLYTCPPQAAGKEASAVLSLVRGAGLLVGYRLHSLVLAASAGVPAMGVAYDPKVSAFCEELDYPCCYPAEVHEQHTLEQLSGLWNARSEASRNTAQRREPLLARIAAAEQQFLEILEARRA